MQRSVDGSPGQPRGCLDEQEAVDFAAGIYPVAKAPLLEEHLSHCERCTALIATAAPHVEGGFSTATRETRSVETQPFGVRPMPHAGHTRDRPLPLLARGTDLDPTFQVVGFVGRGGMGDVYEVKHARLAGRYAAKLLSSDLADNSQAFSRFQREAMIASGLSHPNIVNVIDFCHVADGRPCLVMEYLDGVDLAQVMAPGPLSLQRTLRLVRQIVSALGALHTHQIIHRDMKPQNIFVLPGADGEPERVKLVDFGLAKRSNPSLVVTHDRTLLGTPQYMAPEQAIGNSDTLGPEADQFSLAAIVYEMLAGRHPFTGEVLSTVLYRIVHEAPAPLRTLAPHVPSHVAAAIERGLAKDRQARFPSVKAFLQALEGDGGAIMPTTTPAATTKQQRRSWFIRREILASVGVLAVAVGIVAVVREGMRARTTAEPAVWMAASGRATGASPPATMPMPAPAPAPASITRTTSPTPPVATMPVASSGSSINERPRLTARPSAPPARAEARHRSARPGAEAPATVASPQVAGAPGEAKALAPVAPIQPPPPPEEGAGAAPRTAPGAAPAKPHPVLIEKL